MINHSVTNYDPREQGIQSFKSLFFHFQYRSSSFIILMCFNLCYYLIKVKKKKNTHIPFGFYLGYIFQE